MHMQCQTAPGWQARIYDWCFTCFQRPKGPWRTARSYFPGGYSGKTLKDKLIRGSAVCRLRYCSTG